MPATSDLAAWGWSPALARLLEPAAPGAEDAGPAEPARVVGAAREIYRLRAAGGELEGRPAGRLRAAAELPVVGDWVACRRTGERTAVVLAVLPRRTRLARRAAGEEGRAQVMAANVDTVFLVMGLDRDFNLRRLERLAVVAREGGAEAVVVLTKADLLTPGEVAERRLAAAEAAPGLAVFAVSAPEGAGLDPLAFYLAPGSTVALLGSSGAGKSTLLNRLAGEEVMRTSEVRAGDGRGRHTTTHRRLVRLPGGALLVDGPGLREVGLWGEDDSALDDAFTDVAALARACRFRDCRHRGEPGCAVAAAVEDGTLDAARVESYRGLERELAWLERRADPPTDRRAARAQGALYKRIQADKKER